MRLGTAHGAFRRLHGYRLKNGIVFSSQKANEATMANAGIDHVEAFVGRATLFGIAAGGEAGAAHAIRILRTEIHRVMALLGCPSLRELSEDYLSCADPLTTQRMPVGESTDVRRIRAISP